MSTIKEIATKSTGGTLQIYCEDFSKTGTGFFVSEDGHIVTNNHVVTDMAFNENGAIEIKYSNRILVKTEQGWKQTRLLINPNSDKPVVFDYAILEPIIKPQTWFDTTLSNEIEIGEEVIAIGFPHDFQLPIVTNGIVSSITKFPSHINSLHSLTTIITNTRISHGNSGGPLISVETGKVIGINTLNHELNDEIFQRLRRYINLPGVQLDIVQSDLLLATLKYINIGLFHSISMDYVISDDAWSF
jgi:S1-C subfamily serine protease